MKAKASETSFFFLQKPVQTNITINQFLDNKGHIGSIEVPIDRSDPYVLLINVLPK
jgi:hypothetical protein